MSCERRHSPLGWNILETNRTVGGLLGYSSVNAIVSLKVPSSNGVSLGLHTHTMGYYTTQQLSHSDILGMTRSLHTIVFMEIIHSALHTRSALFYSSVYIACWGFTQALNTQKLLTLRFQLLMYMHVICTCTYVHTICMYVPKNDSIPEHNVVICWCPTHTSRRVLL